MSETIKHSVVIPVYNEESNLSDLYGRLKAVVDGLDGKSEIIFVDDGSKDGSSNALRDIAIKDDRVVVVRFSNNYGQHPAVVAGILQSKGEFVITLDADLQNPPEEIPRLLREIENGYDMVSGKRADRKDTLFRKAPSFLVNVIISAMTGVWMEDYGSMLRVFRADTAKRLAGSFLERQAYITMLIPGVTKNIKEIDVKHDERSGGISKYGPLRLLDAFIRIFFAPKSGKRKDVSDIFVIESIIRDGRESRVTA